MSQGKEENIFSFHSLHNFSHLPFQKWIVVKNPGPWVRLPVSAITELFSSISLCSVTVIFLIYQVGILILSRLLVMIEKLHVKHLEGSWNIANLLF